jgi:uncharacterized membrane protein
MQFGEASISIGGNVEILFAVAVLFLLCFLVGKYSASKGRSFALGFFISLLLSPIVGVIVIAVLKSSEVASSSATAPSVLAKPSASTADQKSKERLRKVLAHPQRKLVIAIVLFFASGVVFLSFASGQQGSVITILFYLFAGIFVLVLHLRDKRFLKQQPASVVQTAMESMSEEKNREMRADKAKKQIKDEIQNGNDTYGRVLLKSYFGFGTVYIYENGYIYSTTRMSAPEKLLAISSNTSLMNSNPNDEQVMGGAMLSVQTESQVFTIKKTTNAKSYVFTPQDLADLQELVMVGNSVIK